MIYLNNITNYINLQNIEKYKNRLLGEFKNGDIVRCEERDNELYAVEKVKE